MATPLYLLISTIECEHDKTTYSDIYRNNKNNNKYNNNLN